MAKAIKTVSTVVSKVEDLGNDTKRFTLVDQDDWELPPFRPGAHIDVHLGQGLVRPIRSAMSRTMLGRT